MRKLFKNFYFRWFAGAFVFAFVGLLILFRGLTFPSGGTSYTVVSSPFLDLAAGAGGASINGYAAMVLVALLFGVCALPIAAIVRYLHTRRNARRH